MRDLRFGTVVTALVVATLTVGCSSSSDDAPAAADPAWSETTKTLGVTSWALTPSENLADASVKLTGYDDAHVVRSQFILDHTQDAAANIAVRIRSLVQGPAVLEYRALPDQSIVILQDTFKDHPDAKTAFSLAAAVLPPAGTQDGSLVKSFQGVHVLDNNPPLVGNQEQLICLDSSGRACEKPPGAVGTGLDCFAGAVGLVGAGCLLSGAETVGIGCVVVAGAAVIGGARCAQAVGERATCSCQTPCAAQCHQTYDRYYMCAPNSAACSNAAANDRMQEESCASGCGH